MKRGVAEDGSDSADGRPPRIEVAVLDTGDIGSRDAAAAGELVLGPAELFAAFADPVAGVEELGEAFDGNQVSRAMCFCT